MSFYEIKLTEKRVYHHDASLLFWQSQATN